MAKRFLASFVGLFIAGGMAMAQAPAAPSSLPASQPVQDAGPISTTSVILKDCNPECADRCICGPAGRFWVSAEYLYWWTKDSRLPALVTSGSASDAIPGAIGQPGTQVLFGDGIDSKGQSGARFEGGFWLNERQTIGLEGGYFFLGSRTSSFATGGSGLPGSPVIARPILDIPSTGGVPFENSEIVSFPGVAAGTVTVENSSRLQGAGANGLCNLWCCDNCRGGRRIDFIGGFRWIELNDSVNINEDIASTSNSDPSFPVGSRIAVNDQFSTRNDFYGPQVGIRGEWRQNRIFVNARTLVALGTTHQQVTINGNTTFTPLGGPTTAASGGLLALPTNIGSYNRNEFSVVPEIGLNVGYELTSYLRAFVGYTFIYWSNVVRPGDVIDVGVNTSQLPTSASPRPLVGPARPAFEFHDSSFWAQGLNIGVELRY